VLCRKCDLHTRNGRQAAVAPVWVSEVDGIKPQVTGSHAAPATIQICYLFPSAHRWPSRGHSVVSLSFERCAGSLFEANLAPRTPAQVIALAKKGREIPRPQADDDHRATELRERVAAVQDTEYVLTCPSASQNRCFQGTHFARSRHPRKFLLSAISGFGILDSQTRICTHGFGNSYWTHAQVSLAIASGDPVCALGVHMEDI
jgi:hypothetical protein